MKSCPDCRHAGLPSTRGPCKDCDTHDRCDPVGKLFARTPPCVGIRTTGRPFVVPWLGLWQAYINHVLVARRLYWRYRNKDRWTPLVPVAWRKRG